MRSTHYKNNSQCTSITQNKIVINIIKITRNGRQKVSVTEFILIFSNNINNYTVLKNSSLKEQIPCMCFIC